MVNWLRVHLLCGSQWVLTRPREQGGQRSSALSNSASPDVQALLPLEHFCVFVCCLVGKFAFTLCFTLPADTPPPVTETPNLAVLIFSQYFDHSASS